MEVNAESRCLARRRSTAWTGPPASSRSATDRWPALIAEELGVRTRDWAFEEALVAGREITSMSGTFAIVGLGTMGRNLALNIEDHGFPVVVWNLETDWTDAFVRDHAEGEVHRRRRHSRSWWRRWSGRGGS